MKIIKCEICGKEAVADGFCPNEIMQSTGFIQDDERWDVWYCSEECRDYLNKEEMLEELKK